MNYLIKIIASKRILAISLLSIVVISAVGVIVVKTNASPEATVSEEFPTDSAIMENKEKVLETLVQNELNETELSDGGSTIECFPFVEKPKTPPTITYEENGIWYETPLENEIYLLYYGYYRGYPMIQMEFNYDGPPGVDPNVYPLIENIQNENAVKSDKKEKK